MVAPFTVRFPVITQLLVIATSPVSVEVPVTLKLPRTFVAWPTLEMLTFKLVAAIPMSTVGASTLAFVAATTLIAGAVRSTLVLAVEVILGAAASTEVEPIRSILPAVDSTFTASIPLRWARVLPKTRASTLVASKVALAAVDWTRLSPPLVEVAVVTIVSDFKFAVTLKLADADRVALPAVAVRLSGPVVATNPAELAPVNTTFVAVALISLADWIKKSAETFEVFRTWSASPKNSQPFWTRSAPFPCLAELVELSMRSEPSSSDEYDASGGIIYYYFIIR